MLSLIGLNLQQVKEICAQVNAQIANINCPGQIVISGGKGELAKAEVLAKERNAKMAVALEVSGAFHSSFMKEASLRLAGEIEKITITTRKSLLSAMLPPSRMLTRQRLGKI